MSAALASFSAYIERSVSSIMEPITVHLMGFGNEEIEGGGYHAKQQEMLAQAERQRLQRQADDDEELVMAASILFRDEPIPSWTIAQPRRRYGRRRK